MVRKHLIIFHCKFFSPLLLLFFSFLEKNLIITKRSLSFHGKIFMSLFLLDEEEEVLGNSFTKTRTNRFIWLVSRLELLNVRPDKLTVRTSVAS